MKLKGRLCNLRFVNLADQAKYSKGSNRNVAPSIVGEYTAILGLSSNNMRWYPKYSGLVQPSIQ
jgi:hypothetical protein